MAWDSSFSADNGGWGADASFSTAAMKDNDSTKTAERLPVPATISQLMESGTEGEKYTIGDYPFSTVRIIGNVKAVREDESYTVYVVTDPENPDAEFHVGSYHGLDDSSTDRFVEGTRIMAIGKLRSFSDDHGIMSYNIREVVDDQEYHAFTLEAKISKLYFEKNVPHLLKSGHDAVRDLMGCMAGPREEAAGGGGFGAGPGGIKMEEYSDSHQQRIYGTHGGNIKSEPDSGSNHRFTGQKGKIMDLLTREKDNYGDVGLSMDQILKGCGTTNVASVRQDLEFLVNEGHCYNTNNEENFALIS